jgi:hypothetical protein
MATQPQQVQLGPLQAYHVRLQHLCMPVCNAEQLYRFAARPTQPLLYVLTPVVGAAAAAAIAAAADVGLVPV